MTGRPLIEFLGLEDQEWPQVSLIMCSHRAPSSQTVERLLPLVNRRPWKVSVRSGDAWIGRARSVAASQWYLNTSDECFAMLDDDIVFDPADIEKLVLTCMQVRGVVCGDYPVHNGEFMAAVPKRGGIIYGKNLVEVDYAPAGCMVVHRTVIENLTTVLPFCHASLPIRHWPFFACFLEDWTQIGGDIVPLSEDFAFTKRAKNLGLPVMLDTSVKLGHLSQVVMTEENMSYIFQAVGERW